MTKTLAPNGGFETEGTQPWRADGWDYWSQTTLETWAGWGSPEIAYEGFEIGWNNDDWIDAFGSGDIEASLFDLVEPTPVVTEAYEDHEEGWSENEHWSDELASIETGIFDGEDFEDFEEDWSNDDWARYFSEPGFVIQASAVGWYEVHLFGQELTFEHDGAYAPWQIAGTLKNLIDASGLPVTATRIGPTVYLVPDDPDLDLQLSVFGPSGLAGTLEPAPGTSGDEIEIWCYDDGNALTVLEPAEFNTTNDTAEDFEREWRSNENFLWSLGASMYAEFDSTEELYEDFEEEWPSEVM